MSKIYTLKTYGSHAAICVADTPPRPNYSSTLTWESGADMQHIFECSVLRYLELKPETNSLLVMTNTELFLHLSKFYPSSRGYLATAVAACPITISRQLLPGDNRWLMSNERMLPLSSAPILNSTLNLFGRTPFLDTEVEGPIFQQYKPPVLEIRFKDYTFWNLPIEPVP